MVQGITRDDEEQAGTRGGFGPPLGFTTLRQRISGQRWAPPSMIPEMRTLSGAKRRDCIIKAIAGGGPTRGLKASRSTTEGCSMNHAPSRGPVSRPRRVPDRIDVEAKDTPGRVPGEPRTHVPICLANWGADHREVLQGLGAVLDHGHDVLRHFLLRCASRPGKAAVEPRACHGASPSHRQYGFRHTLSPCLSWRQTTQRVSSLVIAGSGTGFAAVSREPRMSSEECPGRSIGHLRCAARSL